MQTISPDKVLRLKAGTRVQTTSDTVFLSNGESSTLLYGFVARNLFPALTEGYTLANLESLLSRKQTAAQTRYAIYQLDKDGWLEQISLQLPTPARAYWNETAKSEPQGPCQVTYSFVGITKKAELAWSKVWDQAVAMAAADANPSPWICLSSPKTEVQPKDHGPHLDQLQVLVVGDFRHPDLLAARTTPWVALRPFGNKIWIGPVVVPQSTAKSVRWNRLSDLIGRVAPGGTWLALQGNPQNAFRAHEVYTNGSLRIALQLLIGQLERWRCDPQFLQTHLLVFDPLSFESWADPLPEYLFSDPPSPTQDVPAGIVRLSDLPKGAGQERSLDPDQAHVLLIPYSRGVLAESTLRNVQNKRASIPVVSSSSINPVSKDLKSFQHLAHTEIGRHLLLSRAELGAVAETLERISGRMEPYDFRVKATYNQLCPKAIHPSILMPYSQAQRENRSHMTFVFEPAQPELPCDESIYWTRCWSLTHQEERFVPAHFAFYQAARVLGEEAKHADCDSNGCASGGTLEEAIRYGILELIERDCFGIWWTNRLMRPRIDLSTFSDDNLALVRIIESGGNEVWAVDISNDLGVPAIVAVYRKRNAPNHCDDPMVGLGCHPDPNVALASALHEIIQIGCVWKQQTQDPKTGQWEAYDLLKVQNPAGTMQKASVLWAKEHSTHTDPYLLGDQNAPLVKFSDFPAYQPQSSFGDDVRFLQQKIEDQGLELIVLDQSRSEYPLKVARAIVPGLATFWPRLACPRLYDVPVKMGWLKERPQEKDFNPFPFFL